MNLSLNRPLPFGANWRFGTVVGKVGTLTMTIADLLQITVAFLVLIGVTVLVVTGHVAGSDAISLYGIVLGYAFGVSQGIRAERGDRGA